MRKVIPYPIPIEESSFKIFVNDKLEARSPKFLKVVIIENKPHLLVETDEELPSIEKDIFLFESNTSLTDRLLAYVDSFEVERKGKMVFLHLYR